MLTTRFDVLAKTWVIAFAATVLLGGGLPGVWADNASAIPSVAATVADPAEAEPALDGDIRDERVAALEEDYAAEIDNLVQQIAQAEDFIERERLQHTVQALKAEQEQDRAELLRDIAIENGDLEKADEFTRVLEALDSPPVARQDRQGKARPAPDAGRSAAAPRVKQPDEL